ncbi:hypothetical protein FHP25_37660 [Vineibacter terrae]|uniref:Uncharacterized protein n=1 Tax=Vineibacter terrae TaxID=2586908 RepID=A0A5C8P8E7_9HYPH|nr:hypothetical protein [Vineibacter terrae]TXL69736.1 hypothetical protein FHP25_37660 [Vineibacter terrae]
MRAALILVLALGGPVALFFLWAWASAIKRERKLQGTLPAWQDLPWTNLLIAGLLLAIVGIMAMYFTDDRKGGLLGCNAVSVIPSAARDLLRQDAQCAIRGRSLAALGMTAGAAAQRCAACDGSAPPGEG